MNKKLGDSEAADHASGGKPGAHKSMPDGLKSALQKKSKAHRKSQAAKVKTEAACARPSRNDLQPDLTITKRPVRALCPSPTRTRVTTDVLLEKVIGSIKQFGLVSPVLIDGSDTIVTGHAIWEAACKLGLKTIDCIVVDHLDEVELEALALSLNRISEIGTYDIDILRERMIVIQSSGIALETTGFTLPEIDQILLSPESVDPEPEGEGDEVEGPILARPGDLFELGDSRLLCGDALDLASYRLVLDGRIAQCVFSDPPYNCKIDGFVSGLGKHKDFAMAAGEMDDAAFGDFLATYLRLCEDFTEKGSVIFACMDWRQIDILLQAGRQVGLTRTNIAVWEKGSGGMGGLYRSAYENIVLFCNGKSPATNNVELGRHGRDRTNVWSYPGANQRGSSAARALADHPTPKPVELVADALLDVTKRHDVVLDPFAGSGTTLIAAESTGRICRAIELDPKYVDSALRRWERLIGQPAIHSQTGMTCAELSRARQEEEGEKHD